MKYSHPLMALPMQNFMHSHMRDLLIDKIQIEGKKKVQEKILSGIINSEKIVNPVIRRSFKLLKTIHTKKELTDIVRNYLSHFIGVYKSDKDDEKDNFSGAVIVVDDLILLGAGALLGIGASYVASELYDYFHDDYTYDIVETDDGRILEYVLDEDGNIVDIREKGYVVGGSE